MKIAISSEHLISSIIVSLILCVLIPDVWAGPPFETDDPFTLPFHTGEIYLFASGTVASDGANYDAAPGAEINFSLIRNTFTHVVLPLSINHPKGGKTAYGFGDIELGMNVRIIGQTRYLPIVGVFPTVVLPTGDADRDLGSRRAQSFLPVWMGKTIGPWTTFCGGGYWINPGEGNRDWWFTGLVVQRQIADRVFVGAEVYHQTPDAVDTSPGTGVNLGGGINLGKPYQILFSAGRYVQNADQNEFSFYFALHRTF